MNAALTGDNFTATSRLTLDCFHGNAHSPSGALTWLTKTSSFSADGIPRQNMQTNATWRSNFQGTVKSHLSASHLVSQQ